MALSEDRGDVPAWEGPVPLGRPACGGVVAPRGLPVDVGVLVGVGVRVGVGALVVVVAAPGTVADGVTVAGPGVPRDWLGSALGLELGCPPRVGSPCFEGSFEIDALVVGLALAEPDGRSVGAGDDPPGVVGGVVGDGSEEGSMRVGASGRGDQGGSTRPAP